MLVATSAIIGSHADAIFWLLAFLVLINQVPHRKCMVLRSAKDNRLFTLVYLIHHHTNSFCLPLFDDDNFIEIRFLVYFALFYFTLNNLVVGRVDIIIERRFDTLDLKGREKSVIHALLE